ncbi:hypothetical protein KY284_012224 [Solanum tuberosum]|nr:hypothetical protein KY284_012224 [Solanum tuberosum]
MKQDVRVLNVVMQFLEHERRTSETEESDSESEDDENVIGEDDEEDEIHEILTDLHPAFNVENMNTGDDDVLKEEPNPEVKRFYSLLKEYDQPLYKGLYKHDNSKKMEDLLTLSRGPMKYTTSFKGYIINGYRFHVQDYDNSLRTQNRGIVVAGETDEEDRIIDYYGELTEDEMSLLNIKKSEMGSSSKNLKQSFLPPGALARG